MAARITYRPRARADVRELLQHITGESGPDRAHAYLGRIKATLVQLAAQPYMGRARFDLAPGLRSFPVASHVVFYRPNADGVIVVRVLHGRRDVERLSF